MSLQYGALRPTSGWHLFVSFGHPSKLQRVSRLGFVAATSLTGGQPNFARCMPSPGLLHHVYIFRWLLPLTEFRHVQHSLYVQVLRCRILAALLHGTPAEGVSQTLRRGTRNGITELSQRSGRHLYSTGRPSRWASAYILVIITVFETCITTEHVNTGFLILVLS